MAFHTLFHDKWNILAIWWIKIKEIATVIIYYRDTFHSNLMIFYFSILTWRFEHINNKNVQIIYYFLAIETFLYSSFTKIKIKIKFNLFKFNIMNNFTFKIKCVYYQTRSKVQFVTFLFKIWILQLIYMW